MPGELSCIMNFPKTPYLPASNDALWTGEKILIFYEIDDVNHGDDLITLSGYFCSFQRDFMRGALDSIPYLFREDSSAHSDHECVDHPNLARRKKTKKRPDRNKRINCGAVATTLDVVVGHKASRYMRKADK